MKPKQTEKPSTVGEGPVEVDTDIIVTCGECLWWASKEGADKGKCHRFAPTPDNFNWATTKRTDFCGDARLKPDPQTPIKAY